MRLRTRAIGRCSTAPAEALQTAARHLGRAALGDDHRARARALGAAADGAEVLGVLDLVEGDDHARAGAEDLLGAGVAKRRRLGADALMGRGPAALLDLLGAGQRDRRAAQPRLARRAGGGPHAAHRARARAAARGPGCGRRRSRRGQELGPVGAVAHVPAQLARSRRAAGRRAPSRAGRARPPRAARQRHDLVGHRRVIARRAGSRARARRASRADRRRRPARRRGRPRGSSRTAPRARRAC